MKKQKKLGTAGLADFFRQFSVLVSSGLPVAGHLRSWKRMKQIRDFPGHAGFLSSE